MGSDLDQACLFHGKPWVYGMWCSLEKELAKLTFLWSDNFGKKERSLHRKGMAAIPKIRRKVDFWKSRQVRISDPHCTKVLHFVNIVDPGLQLTNLS